MHRLPFSALLCALSLFSNASAEVLSTSATHFALRQEGTTARSVAATWERLVDPAAWWHPDHTYSGDAANLSLELQAGGLWREDWENGSVAHGTVLYYQTDSLLRLLAPFGPLQGLGAYVVWTISLEAVDGGTRVVFEESAIGPATADYAALAGAVDFVKSEAMRRLTSPE